MCFLGGVRISFISGRCQASQRPQMLRARRNALGSRQRVGFKTNHKFQNKPNPVCLKLVVWFVLRLVGCFVLKLGWFVLKLVRFVLKLVVCFGAYRLDCFEAYRFVCVEAWLVLDLAATSSERSLQSLRFGRIILWAGVLTWIYVGALAPGTQ